MLGIPWYSRGQDSTLSLPKAWVQSLVGELRSHRLQDATKEKKCMLFSCLKKNFFYVVQVSYRYSVRFLDIIMYTHSLHFSWKHRLRKNSFVNETNLSLFGKYQTPPNHLKYRRNKKEAEKEQLVSAATHKSDFLAPVPFTSTFHHPHSPKSMGTASTEYTESQISSSFNSQKINKIKNK